MRRRDRTARSLRVGHYSSAVNIPEGLYDHDWLRLLLRAVDLGEDWSPNTECRFGSQMGIVPTHDAAVEVTARELGRLHPRVVALVDGDGPGKTYAETLDVAETPPSVILRWPDDWMIEDVIGWVLDADGAAALAEIQPIIAPAPIDIADLVARLKSKDRSANGHKGDHLVYEAVATAIGVRQNCRARARMVLNAINDAASGHQCVNFVAAEDGSPRIRIFRP